MDNNRINPQQYVDEFKDIPPMPNVMVRALEVIKNPQTGIRELANIMSVDQSISTKTLSLVNSAYYGFHQQITSINKALVILGMMKAKKYYYEPCAQTNDDGTGFARALGALH